MTVAELIEKLQRIPNQNAEIKIQHLDEYTNLFYVWTKKGIVYFTVKN